MINAGAIAVTSLIKHRLSLADRFDYVSCLCACVKNYDSKLIILSGYMYCVTSSGFMNYVISPNYMYCIISLGYVY